MRQGTITVDGDVTLAYCEVGDGPPVVCLPGWSQAAEQFAPVMEQLASRHRMVAFDHRGHGRSSQPGRGWRLHRLAADLHEALTTLELPDVTLLGHSMGVAVIWAYLDVFGDDGIDRLVFADSRPTLVRDRDWSDAESRVAGGTQTLAQLDDLTHRLRSPDGWDALLDVLRHMVSPDLAPERFEALVATNRPTTNETRAALWYDECTYDWRDLISTISRPTLVVHGLGSMIPTESQQWIANAIPGGALATIPADEGGSHFAFWENPERFGALVADFLDRPHSPDRSAIVAR
jgi:pimeloyl-ACP methyl ester carboxylesterase